MILYKWYIRPGMDRGWYAEREDGRQDEEITGAHCKACAMTEIVQMYGDADVDLRQFGDSPCYQLLAVMVRQRRRALLIS